MKNYLQRKPRSHHLSISLYCSIYKKATRQKKTTTTYVVAKKGMSQKRASRPSGVKGRFKVVDPRLKKDTKGLQRAAKRNGGKGSKGKGRPPPQKQSKGKKR